ncbi:RNase H family protein, partial [Psychrobacter sp. DAB_AL32B]|uniref:RNase H family protein n=1 Tax=Psychrobacter sp. DAB_AL32B TaxID=1028414 RepID=UPI0034A02790
KKTVANKDLWQQLNELCQPRDVDWHWVKGHAGHAGNEKADELANLGVTSSSEDLSTVDTQDTAKKKEQIVSDKKPSTSDDWLKFDPLGFDMMDDELDEELSDDHMVESQILEKQTLESQISESHILDNYGNDKNMSMI